MGAQTGSSSSEIKLGDQARRSSSEIKLRKGDVKFSNYLSTSINNGLVIPLEHIAGQPKMSQFPYSRSEINNCDDCQGLTVNGLSFNGLTTNGETVTLLFENERKT